MVLTLGDVVLPDDQVDFSSYLVERDNCNNLSIFSHSFSDERAKAEEELKNLNVEFEKSSVKESEIRKEVENLSATCTDRLQELEMITTSIKELELRIKDIEDSKSKTELESLESSKKNLNFYKRLVKLKWLHSSTENGLESLIFNEKNAYLKYVIFDENDPLIVDKVWIEICKACHNSWKNLLDRNAPVGTI